LVDDLLDESRIHDARLALHLAPSELDTIVRSAVEEQRLLHPGRRIWLSIPPRPIVVFADAVRTRQVLTNYLTNALKYSPEDQPITVSVEVRMETAVARVAVRDCGPGVPTSEQGRMWERFYRVEGIEVQSGSEVGLGIGLYLSKSLIEAQHGRVGVESLPGEGSTFWFTLPLAEVTS
jgi:signal transduction histidine kinase